MMELRFRDAVPDDADVLATILVSSMRSAFTGLVPEHCLEWPDSSKSWRELLTKGLDAGDFMHMAETSEGNVVGYVWGGFSAELPEYPAELKQLSVSPAFHRQGIGRLLVRDVAKRFAEQNVNNLFVRVLKNNPNRAFYERLGGKFLSQRPYDWDGFMVAEYIYAWDDLQPLL